ncbi:MAG: NfeD family protein [Kiritimatiellae bacterium]|nr:NfeD family protein [Kiritimatiellia bacterium]
MTPDLQGYIILVIAGFFLLGAEVFIPGGVLGVLGGLALLAALVLGFSVFEGPGSLISAVVLVAGSLLYIALWMKYVPRSRLGKMFTLQSDGKAFKSHTDRSGELLHREGLAQTALRPAGIALIDQHRVDVVADAGFISEGTPIKVIRVEGSRVVVRSIGSPS